MRCKDVNWVNVVYKVTQRQVCFPVLQFSPVRIILPTLSTHSSTHFSYQKGKRAKPGNLPKKQRYFGNRGALDGKVLSVFGFQKVSDSYDPT